MINHLVKIFNNIFINYFCLFLNIHLHFTIMWFEKKKIEIWILKYCKLDDIEMI